MRVARRQIPWLVLGLIALAALFATLGYWRARTRPDLGLPRTLARWDPQCTEWSTGVTWFDLGRGVKGARGMGDEWLLFPEGPLLVTSSFTMSLIGGRHTSDITPQTLRWPGLARKLPLGSWRMQAYTADEAHYWLLANDPSQQPRRYGVLQISRDDETETFVETVLPERWPEGELAGRVIGWEDVWAMPEGPCWLFGRLIEPDSGRPAEFFACRIDLPDPFAQMPVRFALDSPQILELAEAGIAIAVTPHDAQYWELHLTTGEVAPRQPSADLPPYGGNVRGPAPGETLRWPDFNAGELSYARAEPMAAGHKDVVLDNERQWWAPAIALVTESSWIEPSRISQLDTWAGRPYVPAWLKSRTLGLVEDEFALQQEAAWDTLDVGTRWLLWKDAAGMPQQAALPADVVLGTEYTLGMTRTTGLALSAVDAVTPLLLQVVVRDGREGLPDILRIGTIAAETGALTWQGWVAVPGETLRGVPGLELGGRVIDDNLIVTLTGGKFSRNAADVSYQAVVISDLRARLK